MYSKYLLENKFKSGKLQLKYLESGNWGFLVRYNNSCTPMSFDPWSGQWIKESYESDYISALLKLQRQGKYVGMYDGCFNIETEGPEELMGKDWLWKEFKKRRNAHENERYCPILTALIREREKGDTSLFEILNIRTCAVSNKKKYGGWVPIIFCPFCGAKLPDRLDETLTRILQNEYGLESWKDYKKAPREFHTDEWWKKRGL